MVNSLSGKQVVLGITGSIAAYKAVELLRRLQDSGAEVQVVLTHDAAHFVTKETLRTLSGRPVLEDLFAEPAEWKVEHVSLADWANLLIIAPATAHTLARLAHGLADDLLCCVALSTRAPILLAPAMDEGMLLHPATQANLARLKAFGYTLIEPEAGALASGKVGEGRLAAIDTILQEAERLLSPQDLAGVKIVVTAGPTREAIDAVRFISNRSSGKMGYALAERARRRGAQVTLISGPTALSTPFGVEKIAVETAAQMYDAALAKANGADIFIGAAAVGDFTVAEPAKGKIKKTAARALKLQPTPDIIAAVAALGRKRPRLVIGFAAESAQLLPHAREKLACKGLDLIVANDINQPQGGFGADYNQAALIFSDGAERPLERLAKGVLADEILDAARARLNKK